MNDDLSQVLRTCKDEAKRKLTPYKGPGLNDIEDFLTIYHLIFSQHSFFVY